MNKIRVGVFFGGRSLEHEVTLWSAKSIIKNLDPKKYEIILIGIDKLGNFYLTKDEILAHIPDAKDFFTDINLSENIPPEINQHLKDYIDVAFPVLHGYLGEDGAIQGFLKILNVPFVGPDILSSAMCMDKEITKIVLQSKGIAVSDYITLHPNDTVSYEEVTRKLGNLLFVKPASSGSSVGVSKVQNEEEYKAALTEAFKYDTKVLVEKAIKGREVECSVIGNENPETSKVCGEIIATRNFYSYEAKYLDESGAKLEIPANLSEHELITLQSTALAAYKALNCEGMCRIDMFLTDDRIIVNELNTIPGFVSGSSMYPLLLCKSGYTYSTLLDELISLALSRHQKESELQRCLDVSKTEN